MSVLRKVALEMPRDGTFLKMPELGYVGYVREAIVDPRIPALVAEMNAAWQRMGAAWGSSDGRTAKPQALQLEARIAVGEAMLASEPGNVSMRRALLQLKQAHSRALTDPDDVVRCERYREAEAAFQRAEEWYLALVHQDRIKDAIYGAAK